MRDISNVFYFISSFHRFSDLGLRVNAKKLRVAFSTFRNIEAKQACKSNPHATSIESILNHISFIQQQKFWL